ncbi:oxygen-independent coproporphyrinogen III oxidase [Lutibacter sp. B2]|nr:oxygen-independent coproporphyrinogen III oxidase [Lutibacter sp. B2]
MKKLGVYIHIPFCIKKCHYCDFQSFSNLEHIISEYVDALCMEIKSSKEKFKRYKIKSIFIGGGTPSILTIKDIDKILSVLYSTFEMDSFLEFSIESNPGTLTKEKVKYYTKSGINRLSIGLQAWQDQLLKKLGRIHDKDTFVKNFHLAREYGFNNINIDLMFSLPNQTFSHWEETLSNIVDLNPEHISSYSLKIEENTIFEKEYKSGRLNLPNEEEDRKMYEYTQGFLEKNGYHRYEISNFSKSNYECEHNKIYWKNEEYIGFGLGAHSYINRIRFSNTNDIKEYIYNIKQDKSSNIIEEKNSLKDEIAETMFLGLRMMAGIDLKYFEERYKKSPFEIYEKQILKLQSQGLLKVDDKNIQLTNKGIDLSNQVFVEFLLD